MNKTRTAPIDNQKITNHFGIGLGYKPCPNLMQMRSSTSWNACIPLPFLRSINASIVKPFAMESNGTCNDISDGEIRKDKDRQWRVRKVALSREERKAMCIGKSKPGASVLISLQRLPWKITENLEVFCEFMGGSVQCPLLN